MTDKPTLDDLKRALALAAGEPGPPSPHPPPRPDDVDPHTLGEWYRWALRHPILTGVWLFVACWVWLLVGWYVLRLIT